MQKPAFRADWQNWVKPSRTEHRCLDFLDRKPWVRKVFELYFLASSCDLATASQEEDSKFVTSAGVQLGALWGRFPENLQLPWAWGRAAGAWHFLKIRANGAK